VIDFSLVRLHSVFPKKPTKPTRKEDGKWSMDEGIVIQLNAI
jgi:hypothetical protein